MGMGKATEGKQMEWIEQRAGGEIIEKIKIESANRDGRI